MIVEKVIDKFDASINDTSIVWYSTLLMALERSVENSKSIEVINKRIGTNRLTVSITPDDWGLAVSQCKNFFVNDSIMLDRVISIESRILDKYNGK